jgi:hypothetical protein
MRIPCSEKDVQLLGEQVPIMFSQHSNFLTKIREIVEIKEEEFNQPT